MVEEQRVPGVSEALYSLGARGIRGLPLAGALSRRHVCFSVVKRAAGRQTGLNQPLPPPPPPSPPDHPASTSCTLSFSLVLSLSLSLFVTRVSTLFLSFRSSQTHLASLLGRRIPLSVSACSSRAGRAPPDQERVSPLGNKLLFV